MNIHERENDEPTNQQALTRKLPEAHTSDESDLIEHYGVSSQQAYESATTLILCLFAASVLLIVAFTFELITK